MAQPEPLIAVGRWHAWLARLLVVAVVGYLAAAWWAGGVETLDAIGRIGVSWVGVGLVLTLGSFAVRIARWQMLLHATGAQVPLRASAAIYLAGIGLSASPGKLGETVRSVFLRRFGVRVGTSLAAFFVDRLSDLLAMLLLAATGSALVAHTNGSTAGHWLLAFSVVGAASVVLRILVLGGKLRSILAAGAARAWLRRALAWLDQAGQDFVSLWRPGLALLSVLSSLLAYGLQGLIFAAMVDAVAPQVPAWTAVAIFAMATLAGAASFIPGGIGAMELTLIMLLRLQGADSAGAVAAALGLRLVTFWFGLLLGAGGLSLAAGRDHG